MSWINRINNTELEIITGDGKSYKPIFRVASNSIPMNESIFEFVNLKGGKVIRGNVGVNQFEVEFHFTGENAIDTKIEFEISAEDKRDWTLIHPYFDSKTVQPSTLNFNIDNIYDVVLTTVLYETISDEQPTSSTDISEDISEDIERVLDSCESNATETDIQTSNRFIERFKVFAVTDEDYQDVISAGNETINNIDNASSFIRSTSNLIRTPAKFYNFIKIRINELENSFTELITIFPTKRNYSENAGALIITAMCECSITLTNDIATEQDLPNLGEDYETRNDVVSSINSITIVSEQYFELLSENQKNGYLPDYLLIRGLFQMLSNVYANLFKFAENAAIQRNYVLEKDMTLTTLHHFLYGNVENIRQFALYNNIGIDELLIIEKGREVIYFV